MKRKLIIGIVGATIVAGIGSAVYAANYKASEPSLEKATYEEYTPITKQKEVKEGVKYSTSDTGATKFIDREVLAYFGDRRKETKALLEHSYKVIDAYLIGSAEVQGLGDFQIDPFKAEDLLKADHEKFKGLFADELERGKAVEEEMKSYTDGALPWNKHKDQWLLKVVLRIDAAYAGAIDNLNWSNTEVQREGADAPGINEEEEYWNIRQMDVDTRFMEARDVLQRYSTWLFGGKFDVEGVQKDDRPIPERQAEGLQGFN